MPRRIPGTLARSLHYYYYTDMPSFGFTEILIILAVGALIFGAKKIPDIGTGLGLGIKNFRKSLKDNPEKSIKAGENENSNDLKKTNSED